MTTHDPLLPAVVLQRKAVVYVRQSTPQQVHLNLESQRRQYELVEVARRRGFTNIEVIDDDLGRTASGAVERPGFDRLVAALCAGQVGAVLCLDASRLARNGRDWHHLLELCGLVEARVIDVDGVYDPCRPNDRLLLGMKGSISEFELGIIRSRMYEAARSKAKRGELRISSPIGYAWDRHVGLGLDPDQRLQEVIRLVFQKFRELGSARQVLLWMASQNVHFPYPSNGRTLTSFEWRRPDVRTTRVAKGGNKQVGAQLRPADLDQAFAKIDLHLFARRRLEPHGRSRLRLQLLPIRLHRPLDGAKADGDCFVGCELLAQHVGIPAMTA
jgi:DNA invertase Pin-like site-specific DNA recombinase